MATQRANGRSSTDLGRVAGNDGTTELPGETGLGSGEGTTSGFGADPAFGTTAGSTDVYGEYPAPRDTREFQRAAGVMDQVKQEASTRVNEQKVRAAEGLGSVASAIRQASEHLRTENQTLATYADRAVDHIQLFADRMRDKDPADMVRDAERFARRNPTAFVGGAFVLGIALARFLKSSGEAQYGDRSLVHRDSDFDEPAVTGTGPARYGGYLSDLSRPGGVTTEPVPGITR